MTMKKSESPKSNLDLELDDLCSRAGAGESGSLNNEYWQSVLHARVGRDVAVALTKFIATVEAESAKSGETSRKSLWASAVMAVLTGITVILTGIMTLATWNMAQQAEKSVDLAARSERYQGKIDSLETQLSMVQQRLSKTEQELAATKSLLQKTPQQQQKPKSTSAK